MGSATDTFIFDAVWQRDVPLTPRIFFGVRRFNSHEFSPRTATSGSIATRVRRSPQGGKDQPLIGREEYCTGSQRSSWRNIFAVASAACGPVPKLGVNFLQAAQDTTTVKYALATSQRSSSTNEPYEPATLTLGQDLRHLGLGAVLWDCVSSRCCVEIVINRGYHGKELHRGQDKSDYLLLGQHSAPAERRMYGITQATKSK